ncbi:MAG TPA: hypothetical protein VKD72_15945 [Gemmataceae bacterium]|nr:hypothetical protein [Gemmataceae bacterium]
MTPIAVQRRIARVVPGLLLLAGCGCGLGDYEQKMLEEQQRVGRIDKENKELADGPLEVPTGQPLDLFLRPPRGVSVQPEASTDRTGFYRYKGDANTGNVYVGWAGKEKDFKDKVGSAFGKGTPGTLTTEPWDREGVALDTVTVEEANRTFHIYLTPGNRLALIYEVPKAGKLSPDALKASLNTLALDADAARQRSEHNKRRKAAK